MEITHNELNLKIEHLSTIVSKGQPFASRNKERRIRQAITAMENEQAKPILFKDVSKYFGMWMSYRYRVFVDGVKTYFRR